jgi:hypothetical protein
MKKLLLIALCLMISSGLFAVANAIVASANITTVGSGWYSIDVQLLKSVNWVANYVIGTSTDVTFKFAWSTADALGPGATSKIMMSDKSSLNVAGDLTVIMTAAGLRGFYLDVPKMAKKLYIQAVITGGADATVTLYALPEYNQ